MGLVINDLPKFSPEHNPNCRSLEYSETKPNPISPSSSESADSIIQKSILKLN
ncbi:hypothetical protein [Flavobacterium sp. LB3R33]|uniref:hypothetical protein n=1 Tax=Flavobacterium sp. LB3R33 TaxID=3401721 RepID=UPI003AAF8A7E